MEVVITITCEWLLVVICCQRGSQRIPHPADVRTLGQRGRTSNGVKPYRAMWRVVLHPIPKALHAS